MAIQFPCGKCGALIEVDDQYAGGQCQCPACNALVPIPQPSVPAGPAIQSAVPPVPTPPPIPNMSPPTMPGMILPPRDPGSKGWAVAALVLGILSFCIPVILVPFVVLFGIIALILVSRNPSKYGGTGLAIAGICAGVAALLIHALFLSILLPSLARARELSKRAVCAANLKGLGTGFYTYANEQSEAWPTPFAPARGGPASPDAIDYVGAIGSYRGKAGDPNAGDINRMTTLPTQFSTTRCMWTLVRMQACTQQSFVCPSNDDSPNEEASPQNYWDFGTGDITGPATAAQVRQGWRQVSYGYQVPYGKHGQPSVDCDPRMILVADKGPFGAALDGGLPAPPPMNASVNSSPTQWRPWNSPNHGGQGSGEGQNALFADGHVAWSPAPIAGVNSDNIYTRWSGLGTQSPDSIHGAAPTPGGKETPASDTDSLIYP